MDCLQARAGLFADIREFFRTRGVLEVLTPALSPYANTDPNTGVLKAQVHEGGCYRDYYLHTSPEFAMKKLLAGGSPSIYQICSVFRDGQAGRYHRYEFLMLEWYRLGLNYLQLMNEVEALLRCCVPNTLPAIRRYRYRDVFMEMLQLDPWQADAQACRRCCEQLGLDYPASMNEDLDEWLDLLMGLAIAPRFPPHALTFIYDYPASQAALARLAAQDSRVAERFELYWGALELANGFSELTNAQEQRRRFAHENQRRADRGLPQLPMDESLLAALESGLPECAGVALGLERLLMAMWQAAHIEDVIP